jgi:hypothetical protein
VEDVNIHIDELIMEHPAIPPDQHLLDALHEPLAEPVGTPVAAEIRRAVSAALDADR